MSKKRLALLALIPIGALLILVAIFWQVLSGLSAADILNYLPPNTVLAVLALMGLYALKSLSIMFPLMVLQIAAGIMFGPVWGLVINLLGMCIELALPYLVGRMTGPSLHKTLLERFPQLNKIEEYRCDNQIMFSYLLRAVGVLPGDVVSWYLGSTRMSFWPFFIGGHLGTLTGTLIATLFGDTVSDGISIPVLILWAVLLVASYIITHYINKHHRNSTKSA